MSWKAPAKLLAELTIESARLCEPFLGKAVLLAAELPAPPLKPSHDPTKGAPSNVMGSSNPKFATRLVAKVEEVSANKSPAAEARIFMGRCFQRIRETSSILLQGKCDK